MNQSQNRTEKRSLQRVQLRKLRTEYKKSMKTLRSNYFDYNPKKFRKTLFYHQYKQESKINATADSTVTCKYKEDGTSLQTDTDMASCNYERTSQAEDKIRLVSNRNDQVTEGDAIFEEQGVQINTLALSDDLEHVAENAYVADIAEETSPITEFHNRSERRSLQRVELREIRTDYKRQMKGVSCRDYNAKKFKKTLFYSLFKQASVIITQNTSVNCNYQDTTETDSSDISTSQINTVNNIRVTSASQEESPSAQVITDMVFDNYECIPVTEDIHIANDREEWDVKETPSSDTGTYTVMSNEEFMSAVKDVDSIQDSESFKLEWNTLSLISEDVFDGSLDTLGKLQTRTHAADSESTELGEEKRDKEERLDKKEDAIFKDDEDKEEEYERSLNIYSSFCEKSLKEAAWMVTPPSSIMSVICEKETSLLVKPAQSINEVVFSKPVYVQPRIIGRVEKAVAVSAIQKATISPVQAVKKKRLRALKEKAGTIVPKITTVRKRLFN